MAVPSTAVERGASLRIFMNELTELEGGLNTYIAGMATSDKPPSLQLLRWRRTSIEPPSLYHQIVGSDSGLVDPARLRDTITVSTRIAVAIGDDGYESDWLLEQYIDIYRTVMDPPLHEVGRPLDEAATFANRTTMRTLIDTFNDVPFLAVEFLLGVQLNRRP